MIEQPSVRVFHCVTRSMKCMLPRPVAKGVKGGLPDPHRPHIRQVRRCISLHKDGWTLESRLMKAGYIDGSDGDRPITVSSSKSHEFCIIVLLYQGTNGDVKII